MEEHRLRERAEPHAAERAIDDGVRWSQIEGGAERSLPEEARRDDTEGGAGIGAAVEEMRGDRETGGSPRSEGQVDAAARQGRDEARRVADQDDVAGGERPDDTANRDQPAPASSARRASSSSSPDVSVARKK
jgi:hypothetical protein